jgi:hypothetical protein
MERIHTGMIEVKARPSEHLSVLLLFRSEWLSANVNLTLHKALIRRIMNYAPPPGNLLQISNFWNCIASKTKLPSPLAIFQGAHRSPICMWLSKFRTCVWLHYKIMQAGSRNHTKSRKCKFSQNAVQGEAQSRKYNGITRCGGVAYFRR